MLRTPELVFQSTNWSCGLACVAMLTGQDEGELVKTFSVKGGSVWTIDLLDLLPEEAIYYSTLLDVPDSHGMMRYYQKLFAIDSARVRPLLKAAGAAERAREVAFTTEQMRDSIGNFVFIVLVHKWLLGGDRFSGVEGGGDNDDDEYNGHYILVHALDGDSFVYLDPDRTYNGERKVSLESLEAARRVNGTDYDIIVIPRPGKSQVE